MFLRAGEFLINQEILKVEELAIHEDLEAICDK